MCRCDDDEVVSSTTGKFSCGIYKRDIRRPKDVGGRGRNGAGDIGTYINLNMLTWEDL